jgi:hypothetical protein
MLELLWYSIPLPPGFEIRHAAGFLSNHLAAWLIIALLVNLLLMRLLKLVTRTLPVTWKISSWASCGAPSSCSSSCMVPTHPAIDFFH